MNKFLRKYVVCCEQKLFTFAHPFSVYLWITNHFLLSIQSIPCFLYQRKSIATTNHPFIMPPAHNGRHSGGGRIRVDERVVDDESPIIGANIAVDQAHVVGIVQIEQASMSDKCKKEYRNRIKHIYRWLMEKYPDYFEVGTRVLTQDERDDPVFFAHTNDRDLRYAGINVLMIPCFLHTLMIVI
jgi:hypothetical protein